MGVTVGLYGTDWVADRPGPQSGDTGCRSSSEEGSGCSVTPQEHQTEPGPECPYPRYRRTTDREGDT